MMKSSYQNVLKTPLSDPEPLPLNAVKHTSLPALVVYNTLFPHPMYAESWALANWAWLLPAEPACVFLSSTRDFWGAHL